MDSERELHHGTIQIQDEDFVLRQQQVTQVQIGVETSGGMKGGNRPCDQR